MAKATPQPETSGTIAADSDLDQIRKQLRETRVAVDDAELREEISEWLEESHEKTDADTAAEFVEARLNRLLSANQMYGGEENFPDECVECDHYGAACPVLKDRTERLWRERKLAEASTEAEARSVYQEQARDVDCGQISAFLTEWSEDHAEFIREGERLLRRAEEATFGGGS